MSAQMQWFRLYNRMVDDEKLRLLAFEDRWHFVALCCLASSGLLDEPDSDLRQRKIAVKLGVQIRELDEIARRLHEVELIDENLRPVNWDELQYRSDTSNERVKKYREKQRCNSVKRCGNVTATFHTVTALFFPIFLDALVAGIAAVLQFIPIDRTQVFVDQFHLVKAARDLIQFPNLHTQFNRNLALAKVAVRLVEKAA